MRPLLAVPLLALLPACAATRSDAVDQPTPFDPSFTAPFALATGDLRLEPLRPAVAQLDYDGFMSSIDHLRDALRWGSWPSPDFRLEQNVQDLQRHWDEFGRGEAYAYTVLAPDRSRCLGCVYVNPTEGEPRSATVAYWITADGLATDFDVELLRELVAWFERDWPLDEAVFPTHREYARGFRVGEAAGLVRGEAPEDAERVPLVWSR